MAASAPSAGCSQSGELAGLPGFSSVPPKLIKKIIAKEYVDIYELLPETWQVETEGLCCHTKRPRRSLIVTDISVWTECFATMAAILAVAVPAKAPQFFAYLHTITKASCTFESSAWASYDMAYRRQAANRGSLDWGVVDAALYNEAFAGRAKLMTRCRYCLADTHASQECLHAPAGSETLPSAVSGTAVAESRQGRVSFRSMERPVQALRFVGYLMHQAAHGAGSHSAAMHMCAPSADAHTQQQSVGRDASRQRQTPRGLELRHLPRHHRPSREASPCLEVTIVVLVTPVVARQGFFSMAMMSAIS